jgi:hypothetical protein
MMSLRRRRKDEKCVSLAGHSSPLLLCVVEVRPFIKNGMRNEKMRYDEAKFRFERRSVSML